MNLAFATRQSVRNSTFSIHTQDLHNYAHAEFCSVGFATYSCFFGNSAVRAAITIDSPDDGGTASPTEQPYTIGRCTDNADSIQVVVYEVNSMGQIIGNSVNTETVAFNPNTMDKGWEVQITLPQQPSNTYKNYRIVAYSMRNGSVLDPAGAASVNVVSVSPGGP